MALTDSHVEAPPSQAVLGKSETKLSALSVKNVLFATDFSPCSEAALPYATAICRRFDGTLHLVHILSDAGILMMSGGVDYVCMGTLYDDAHNEAREKLNHVADHLTGIPFRNYVRHGQVWRNLAAIVHEKEIDLIVIGTHGRTGLGKLLLGSVAENILRHACCPVLTIGPKVSGHSKLPTFPTTGRDLAPVELELRQIVCAVDFGNHSARVAQEAIALAEDFRSRLILLHVMEDYTHLGSQPNLIEEAMEKLHALLPMEESLEYTPETQLEFGAAAERIVRVATEREADIIVLGARRAAEVGTTHLPWSSAHHVIALAQCPVLTIRE